MPKLWILQMKRVHDPRHLKRIKIIEELFAQSFASKIDSSYRNPHHNIVTSISEHIFEIDPLIESAAPQFPINKIAKIDVAILRLAIYELLYERKQPVKVIIDEAIELAKEYGGEGSPAFVNGVLGHIIKSKPRNHNLIPMQSEPTNGAVVRGKA